MDCPERRWGQTSLCRQIKADANEGKRHTQKAKDQCTFIILFVSFSHCFDTRGQVKRALLETALRLVNISGPSRSPVTSRSLCLSSPPFCQDPVAQDADLSQT